MSTGPKNITNGQLKTALRKHAGVYALAARELGCDRTNVMQRVNRSPELKQLCVNLQEEIGDAAEGVILNSILKGNVQTALAYAKMKLRDRGYVTKTEITGADGAPLQTAPAVSIHVSYVEGASEPEAEEEIL